MQQWPAARNSGFSGPDPTLSLLLGATAAGDAVIIRITSFTAA